MADRSIGRFVVKSDSGYYVTQEDSEAVWSPEQRLGTVFAFRCDAALIADRTGGSVVRLTRSQAHEAGRSIGKLAEMGCVEIHGDLMTIRLSP